MDGEGNLRGVFFGFSLSSSGRRSASSSSFLWISVGERELAGWLACPSLEFLLLLLVHGFVGLERVETRT